LDIFQAVLLGIVQGLTEFIPISSSAHLVILPWLLNWQDPGLAFDIALHLGTLVALLAFFARDWIRLIRAGIASIVERKIGDDVDRRLAWLIVIASVPGAIAGALAESKIEELFHAPNPQHNANAMIAMGVIIALLGAALFAAERLARHLRNLDQISLKDAILIGCAQALAIFPGVSRSGATITAGLALGFERESAARFSFLLSAPLIAGAGAKSMFDLVRKGIAPDEMIFFAVGFLVAALSGYLCIKFLLRFLQNNTTNIFVFYRWGLAILVITVALMRG
jgi:undecaprenyl-diphosphatase